MIGFRIEHHKGVHGMSSIVKFSRLKGVDPKTAEPKKPKVLVYGAPGVGKTWTSLDFPKVFYVDTEGGANLDHYTDKLKKSGGVYFGVEQGALDFNEVIGQIQALATEDHPYKTLVIDSFTKLFNTAIANEAQRIEDAGKKNEFGIDKKPAIAQTKKLINWLSKLDMNVILICHEKPEWGIDSSGVRTQIGMTFDAFDKLSYELDLSLNIFRNGPKRLSRIKKSRLLGFPDGESFEWSYDGFAERYGRAVIERKSEKIKLATEEQVKEIERLLDLVKLPEDWLEKTLAKVTANSVSELNDDQASKTISFLKGKLQ
jgi:hypothetical protein